jgi:NAD(P)-dependent dehydrogenase (short-subunit alcohol dehydrogenase family)
MNSHGAVVVTGASSGIGAACALHLDRLGYLVFAGVRKKEDGDALKGRASERLRIVFIDVVDATSIATAAETVEAAVAGGGLSGLVNNAGIAVVGPLEFLSVDDLRKQFEVNVIGPIAVTQAFLPLLRRGHGRIVNMGSIGGRWATPFAGPYSASKFALEALTDALRVELHASGIEVSIIEPGNVATPIWEKSKTSADIREAKFPEVARQIYGRHMAAVRRFAENAAGAGIDADVVAQAVAHALMARRPKTRYLVGRDAKVRAALAKALPDRMRDVLVMRRLGLPEDIRLKKP